MAASLPGLEAARRYCRMGFSPLPVPHRTKGCVLEGWQHLRLREEDLPRYFNRRRTNIGVLVGEPSGNYVDVDLDCVEAVRLAPHFLPETPMLHGHGHWPYSHWGYRVPMLPPSQRFTDVEAEANTVPPLLIELWTGVVRTGTGGLEPSARQIVVPPSVHEGTGEPIVWARGEAPEPATIEAESLVPCVHRLAAATLLARHWPARGSRNRTALALAGWLLRAGLHETLAALLIEAAATAAGDDEAPSRARCVRDTARRLADGEEAVGAPTLEALLTGNGAAVVDAVSGWLGLREAAATPSSSIALEVRPAAPYEKDELNERSSWPEPPAAEAFAGLAGRVVDLIDGYTEADRVAVLGHFLAMFGIAAGPGAHAQVGATAHPGRENFVMVGKSARSRKGDAANHVGVLFCLVDSAWAMNGILSGLSTGEGLIWSVRDPIYRTERKKGKGIEDAYEQVLIDPGVDDKRLLALEPEFARMLQVMERQTNTLSAVVRQAWDTGNLRTMTRAEPARATGAHLGIVGHITAQELRQKLNEVELVNGFANRFLWLAVRRSKELAEPAPFAGPAVAALAEELSDTLRWARSAGRLDRDLLARGMWYELYPELTADRDGMVGAVLARAEAHVLRLSVLYALLDRQSVVRVEHLRSALALWQYADRSAVHIFGDRSGDPIADAIKRALKQHGELTRSQILALFGRNMAAARITGALESMVRASVACCRTEPTGGRPVEIWSLRVRA